MAILNAKQQADHRRNKFMAAIQGIDLDAQQQEKEEDPLSRVAALMAEAESEQGLEVQTKEQRDFGEWGIEILEVD